jgi:hypothetical protein
MANESNPTQLAIMFWWAIPLELLLLAFSFIGLVSSIVFIFVVVTRHELRKNLALLLAVNLSIGGLITCVSMISQAFHMLMNSAQDRLCPFRSYFFTVGMACTFFKQPHCKLCIDCLLPSFSIVDSGRIVVYSYS